MPRRYHEEEHENHERWLVSYADFITLLFAFFVVMYAISQVNEGKYKVLSNSLVNAFQDKGGDVGKIVFVETTQKPTATGVKIHPSIHDKTAELLIKKTEKRMHAMADSISTVMKPLVDEGQVKVSRTKRGIAVEINASVLFAPANAQLNPDSTKALAAVADLLVEAENAIQVEGYTDNTPIKTPQYPSNWELSSARASSVVRLFVERGISVNRLSAIGYAENRAKYANTNEEGRSKNRRVTVTILAETPEEASQLPAL